MRRLVLGLAAMVAMLGAAGPARAADGDPYVRACAVVTTTPGCTPATGLPGHPLGLVASPDGRQLYVSTSAPPYALQIVDRDPATGALTPRAGQAGCFAAQGSGAPCTPVPHDLTDAERMAMSHDGRSLLVIANASIYAFARDLGSGALTYQDCYGARTGCRTLSAAANSVTTAAFSPDDAYVYVRTQGGLDVVRRDAGTLQSPATACYTRRRPATAARTR
jgi:DNA-binding beta-propeller fold protein YncE